MKRVCRELQERIATRGTEAARTDEAAQRHLADCAECFGFLEAFAELDAGLEGLPRLDAPDAVVEALLRSPELAGPAASHEVAAEVGGPSRGAHGLAATAVRFLRRPVRPRFLAWSGTAAAVLLVALFVGNRQTVEQTLDAQLVEQKSEEQVTLAASNEEDESDKRVLERELGAAGATAPPPPPRTERPQTLKRKAPSARPLLVVGEQLRSLGYVGAPTEAVRVDPEPNETEPHFKEDHIADLPAPGRFYQNRLTVAPGVGDDFAVEDARVHGSRDRDLAAMVGGVSNVDPLTGQFKAVVNPNSIEEIEKIIVIPPWDDSNIAPEDRDTRSSAREFLRQRLSLAGLNYLDPTGYWSNTYVPGDPAFRLLRARLARSDRSALQAFAATPLRLHDASRPAGQPFDAPENAALAVYLHADRRGIEEEGRVLLQVGLQATERHGGRRPAMNVALVLDLRGDVPAEVAQGMRALVMAFGQARDVGDRFCIVVAGRRGGIVVEPRDFRHGYLSVTLDRLLSGQDDLAAPALGLGDAVATAIEAATAGDDPQSPLGSSAVVLVTGQPLGPEVNRITELAHLSAVAGVPLSGVAVGSGVALDSIDRVTLAGQGNRRLLQAPSEAPGLVDRELSSVGRTVARAVRLRIRLSPGTRLVEVVGSERLDEARAERVREAEQSIDRRIARNLGILADRGEDEDGIQIVIPSIYAGDSHVILLDVAVKGPGKVADVTVRYKDLVYLRNGVTRAGLSLDDEWRAAGPLERNVLKNFLAQRLSRELARAGGALAAGNSERAVSVLTEIRNLLAGLRMELPDLDADVDLQADIRMLDEYATLLRSDAVATPALKAQLSDSLLYAGRLKVLPPPESN